MISLGIPGDSATAVLLGGFLIHGIQAGPLLMSTNPVYVNVIFLAALWGALMVLAMEVLGMPLFPSILKIPHYYLYPAILVLCFTGAYISTYNLFAVFVTISFSLVGCILAYAKLPTSPFILAFVLGTLIETNMRRAMGFAQNGAWSFFTRPVSGVLLLIALLCVVNPFISSYRKKRKQKLPE
jgi:putative tricarboxylic transport membrane protein